jgi:hypothetical protein
MRKVLLICTSLAFLSSAFAFMAKTPDAEVVLPRTQGSSQIKIPRQGQNGRTLEIKVPSDSNAKPAEVTIDGQRVELLSESPHKIVVTIPGQLAGPVKVRVKKGDHEAEETCRIINVNVTATKTNLLKGERATVTVKVTGLDGITQRIPLRLTSKGVINTQGGSLQLRWIHPQDVQRDGTYTTTITITGIQPGVFDLTATVITRPWYIRLGLGAPVDGFRVKKKGKSVGLTIENVKDPLKGDELDGVYEVEYVCSDLNPNIWVQKLVFKKGRAELTPSQLEPCLTEPTLAPGTMFDGRQVFGSVRFEF